MNPSDTSLLSGPYGLAFQIEDLVAARAWARQRNLQLTVLLDSVVDGAEFEEMLVLAPEGSLRRTLTIWRTKQAVYAQTPSSRPHEFSSMSQLLADLRPAPQRRLSLLKRLGLAG